MADWSFADGAQPQDTGGWSFTDEPAPAAHGWSFEDEEPQTSTLGASLGEAALAVPRVLGATIGGVGGAVAGSFIPGGQIPGALVGGVAGGEAGEAAKDWALDKLGLSDSIKNWEAAAQGQHPIASGAGEVAPWLLGGEAGAGAEIGRRALSGSIAGLVTAGADEMSGEGIHPGEVLENAAVGALLPGQRKWVSNIEQRLAKAAGKETQFLPKAAANKSDLADTEAAKGAEEAGTQMSAAEAEAGGWSFEDEGAPAKVDTTAEPAATAEAGVVQTDPANPVPPDQAAVLTEGQPPAEMSSQTGQNGPTINQPANPAAETAQPPVQAQVHPATQAAIQGITPPKEKPTLKLKPSAAVPTKDHPLVQQAVTEAANLPVHELDALPSIANSGPRGIYVDRSVPAEYRPFLAIHEHVEDVLMKNGATYDRAHDIATQVELTAVKDAGIDPGAYKRWFADNRARIEAQPWPRGMDAVYGFHEPVEQALGHYGEPVTAPVTTGPKPYVSPETTERAAPAPNPLAHPALSDADVALVTKVRGEIGKQMGPEWTARFDALPPDRQVAVAQEQQHKWEAQLQQPEPKEGPKLGRGAPEARKRSAMNAWEQVFQKYGTPAGQLDPNDRGAALQRATAAVREAAEIHGADPLNRNKGYQPAPANQTPAYKWLQAARDFVRHPGNDDKFNEFMTMHAGAGELAHDPDLNRALAKSRRPTVDTVQGTVGNVPTEEPAQSQMPKPRTLREKVQAVDTVIRSAMNDDSGHLKLGKVISDWVGGKAEKEQMAHDPRIGNPDMLAITAVPGWKEREEARLRGLGDRVKRDGRAADNAVSDRLARAGKMISDFAKKFGGPLTTRESQQMYRLAEAGGEEKAKASEKVRAGFEMDQALRKEDNENYAFTREAGNEVFPHMPELPGLHSDYIARLPPAPIEAPSGAVENIERSQKMPKRTLDAYGNEMIPRDFMTAHRNDATTPHGDNLQTPGGAALVGPAKSRPSDVFIARHDDGTLHVWQHGKMVPDERVKMYDPMDPDAARKPTFEAGQPININGTDYVFHHSTVREINEHFRYKLLDEQGLPQTVLGKQQIRRREFNENYFVARTQSGQFWARMRQNVLTLSRLIGNEKLNDDGNLISTHGGQPMQMNPVFRDYMVTEKPKTMLNDGVTPNPRGDWEKSTLFPDRDWYFHPVLREVFDDMARAGISGDWGVAISNINQRLLKLQLTLGSIRHVFNDAVLGLTRLGWEPLKFWNYGKFANHFSDAFKSVRDQDGLQSRMQDAGVSLEYLNVLAHRAGEDIPRIAGMPLPPENWIERNKTINSFAQMAKNIFNIPTNNMWFANDVLATVLFKHATETMGMEDRKAADWLHELFPDYLPQQRILGRRDLANALNDTRAFNFGRYRGGVLNAISNIGKDAGRAVFKNDPVAQRNSWNNIGGILSAGMFVMALSELAKLVTGNDKATIGAPGIFTIPNAIASVFTGDAGDQTYTKPVRDIFGLPPLVGEGLDLYTNHDVFGRPIVAPQDLAPFEKDPRTVGQRVSGLGRGALAFAEHGAAQSIGPFGMEENFWTRQKEGANPLGELAKYLMGIQTPSPKGAAFEAKKPKMDYKALKYRNKHPRGMLEGAYDWATQ